MPTTLNWYRITPFTLVLPSASRARRLFLFLQASTEEGYGNFDFTKPFSRWQEKLSSSLSRFLEARHNGVTKRKGSAVSELV
ncbi:MAG: hypothetical protein ABR556_05375 [Pyrinomonadaceae bacterium]